eukprot:TRINITY_DN14321_c0_g1_i1.p1 TRINITY_DN14321_c0_g1~~TRINITY_DN14321_c0_g1_i1.p1  ORF type:complete len:357 (+),score=69.85 TRINITY_DN14321_c0_g1_i1:134-1204(+)
MEALKVGQVVEQRMPKIDLRSDTVSWPTLEMRLAMANAVVGDDVWEDDPTVQELEEYAAQLFGKEAALFVTSGTQGNLISVLTHCRPGDEIIIGDKCHMLIYEGGGMSAVGGVIPCVLPTQPDGTLPLKAIQESVRDDNVHYPTTRLIALENTHNKMGGVPLSISYINSVADFAHEKGLVLHMDGARIFNAAAALNEPVAKIVEKVDSVTFCLSKGLCAPVGSIICGTREFIRIARRKRKMLGGGLRQVGVLAAAGLVGLKTIPSQIHLDHEAAKILADCISTIPQLRLVSNNTNFVFFSLMDESKLTREQLENKLEERGILCKAYSGTFFRFVTHHWVTPEKAHVVARALRELFE